MTVICETSEFDGIKAGYIYEVEDLGVNSFKINGKWYGRSNFTLVL